MWAGEVEHGRQHRQQGRDKSGRCAVDDCRLRHYPSRNAKEYWPDAGVFSFGVNLAFEKEDDHPKYRGIE